MRRTRNEAGNKRGIILLLIGVRGPFAMQCCGVRQGRKSFAMRSYEKCVCKCPGMCSYGIIGLKVPWNEQLRKRGGGRVASRWIQVEHKIETSRRFGVDKTCPLPKAFLQVAKGLLAGCGSGDFVRVNTLHVSRIDGRDHIKVSLARKHAVVCVGGCRYRRGIQLLVRPARLRATVDVVADSPGRTGIPA